MKKLLYAITAMMLLSAMVTSASAVQYVIDNGNVLTDDEEAYLESAAYSASCDRGIDIVVLTEDGINGADPMYYAADFYDYGGYADNGVILFLEMELRDWRLVTTGSMNLAVGDYGLGYVEDYAVPYFSEGDYCSGFEQYINIAADLYDGFMAGEDSYSSVIPGQPYVDDYYDDYYEDYDYNEQYSSSEGVGGIYYAAALGISLLIAFLVCSGFKKQLNTAVKKSGAGEYFDQSGVTMIQNTDRFLYSRTSKVRKSNDSSHNSGGGGGMRSFSGSSGRSHRGGGGKF
ncbi:MAG: TPM domain-containing protein [Ruminococcaceae bacterium]|nr:TPM domain-containing protein [Oscillospiraceae bacterium]